MSNAFLRFSTDILRRLGEELNPSIDQGILELVKNAYDADALQCTVELQNTHVAGGTIQVIDDGDGMDQRAIRDGWLVLGTSGKQTSKQTRRGRFPAGNKGLGRLAAIRLGSTTTLVTHPRNKANYSYKLKIRWDDYTKKRVVEDVKLQILQSRRPNGTSSGSTITITDVRTNIGRTEAKRLARSLLLLADPFADNKAGFQPRLVSSEFRDLEKLVQRRYFDDAEYHLIAKVDKKGFASAKVTDFKGQELFSATHATLRPKSSKKAYKCPPATFDLWAFILEKEAFDLRTTTIAEVREWLQEFGGVHFYNNGLRVSPYGNPGNDWLDLNLSRVRSPELRPSTNTSIGRVAVNDATGQLTQKTDRSGFVENEAFNELKLFAADALDWMAKMRLQERDRKRTTARASAPSRVSKARTDLGSAIDALPRREQEQVRKQFDSYDKAREREATALRREVQLYRTLSTAGITAAIFAHESKHPLQILKRSVDQVERAARRELDDRYDEVLARPIERLVRQADSLQAFSNLTLAMVEAQKRRVGRVELHHTIDQVILRFEPFVRSRDVEVERAYDVGNPFLRASEASIESIITNLITNSLKAFEDAPPGKRKLLFKTEVLEGTVHLRVIDNGPGIKGIDIEDIWLPGQTTGDNGTGLGLTIVRDSVADLGGRVEAVATGEMGGAEVLIALPILGA